MNLLSKFYLVGIFLFIQNQLFSQDQNPGNVSNPHAWIKAKKVGSFYALENILNTSGIVLPTANEGKLFNANPSILFDAQQDSLLINLSKEQAKAQTFFIVYQLKEADKEQFIWNLTTANKTVSIATTDRFANLETFKYKTYSNSLIKNKANIHFYHHNKSSLKTGDYTISIGKNTKEQLPPQIFKGYISEIILYNRVLSSLESQKVASYLAVKYGITLSQLDTKNYLNSSGDIIWDYESHKKFSDNITAIGKDLDQNLVQQKSTNMANEGLVTMKFRTIDSIANNYFTFWSDNNKPLLLKKQEEGFPNGVSRKWVLNYVTNPKSGIDWTFDLSQLEGKINEQDYYWLAIDPSGKAEFGTHSVQYVMLSKASKKEPFTLENYNWDAANTNQVAYTIQIAPEMFAQVAITHPECDIEASGKLDFKIQGGQAPYTITLLDTYSGNLIKKWTQNNQGASSIAINSGYYDYQVLDANNRIYKQTLFVTNSNTTIPNLEEEYVLNETPIHLDLTTLLPVGEYKATWFLNDVLYSEGTTIIINETGEYELHLVNDQDCKSISKFQVMGNKSNQVEGYLYPNPSLDGQFSIFASYPKVTPIIVTIHSISGSLIDKNEYKNQATYSIPNSINTSGVYMVKVSSDFGEKNYKVIVK